MAGVSKIGALQEAILRELATVGDATVAFLASGMSTRAMFRNYRKLQKSRVSQRIRHSISALKNRRLVNIKEKNGETYITLTEDGKARLLKYKFENMRLIPNSKWDGRWHVAMFDIPEKHGKARRALSYKIREMGAFHIQKSVFIYPFPWRDEIDFVSEFFQVSQYVRYIEAVNVEGANELRLHFGV